MANIPKGFVLKSKSTRPVSAKIPEGFIRKPPTPIEAVKGFVGSGVEAVGRAGEDIMKAAPEALQIGGGVVGSFMAPAHPHAGSAVGGTAGRIAGEQLVSEYEEAPLRTAARTMALASPIPTMAGLAGAPPVVPEEKLKETLKTGGKAAVVETLFGVGSKLAGMALKHVGTAVGDVIMSRPVVEQAQKVGWRKLVDPKYFENRVPQFVADGVDKLFTKASRVTGEAMDRIINNDLVKRVRIPLTAVKNKVKAILPEGTTLDMIEASPIQKKELHKLTGMVLGLKGTVKKVGTIWELRKKFDVIAGTRKWSDEAYDYLRKLRRALNDPIRSAGDDVAREFDNYAFIKDVEDEIGKKINVVRNKATGETFAPKLESFMNNLLSSSKDETIRMLQAVDDFLDLDDKIVKDLLTASASEIIQKGESGIGMGIWQKFLTRMLGGREALARVAARAEETPVKAAFRGALKTVPTAVTTAQTQD